MEEIIRRTSQAVRYAGILAHDTSSCRNLGASRAESSKENGDWSMPTANARVGSSSTWDGW